MTKSTHVSPNVNSWMMVRKPREQSRTFCFQSSRSTHCGVFNKSEQHHKRHTSFLRFLMSLRCVKTQNETFSWTAYFPNAILHTILTRHVLSTHLLYLMRNDCIYIVNYLNMFSSVLVHPILWNSCITQGDQYGRFNKKGMQLECWFDFQDICVKLW